MTRCRDIQILVGKRLRELRRAANLTQADLAAKLGIRPQQVARYEAGENSISAIALWEISEVLSVPIGAFFRE